MRSLSRRRFLAGTAAAATLTLPSLRQPLAQTPSITVTSYAGVWEEAVREIFVADFTERTGAQAEILVGNPLKWLDAIEANRSDPPIAVLVNSIDLATIAGRSGLVDKVDPSKLSNLADIPSRFVDMAEGWGVVFDYGSAGIAYNKDALPNPPQSIKAMVDRALAGDFVLSLPGIDYVYAPQILIWSLADVLGGGVENVDPTFEMLKALKDRNAVIFYRGVGDFLDQLAGGDAQIGIYWDGRTWAHFAGGADWIAHIHPEEGSVLMPIVAQKVANAPEIAWEYIDTMLAPGPQLAFAEALHYGVTNAKVVYPPWLEERLVPWDDARLPPFERIGSKAPEWLSRWNEELGP